MHSNADHSCFTSAFSFKSIIKMGKPRRLKRNEIDVNLQRFFVTFLFSAAFPWVNHRTSINVDRMSELFFPIPGYLPQEVMSVRCVIISKQQIRRQEIISGKIVVLFLEKLFTYFEKKTSPLHCNWIKCKVFVSICNNCCFTFLNMSGFSLIVVHSLREKLNFARIM